MSVKASVSTLILSYLHEKKINDKCSYLNSFCSGRRGDPQFIYFSAEEGQDTDKREKTGCGGSRIYGR